MSDITKMTREQLIIMVMNLQDENERLRKENSDMGWRLNPGRKWVGSSLGKKLNGTGMDGDEND